MKKEIEKEIKEISPEFPMRKSPVKEPLSDGYFEDLQHRVIERVLSESEEKVTHHAKHVSIRRFLGSIAAVILVVVCAWIVMQLTQSPGAQNSILSDLSKEDALAYVLEYPEEMGSILLEMEEPFDMPSLYSPDDLDTEDPDIIEALIEEITTEEIEEIL